MRRKKDLNGLSSLNPLATPVVMNGWSIRDALPGQTDILPDFTIIPLIL